MKKILVLLAFLHVSASVFAQENSEETLIGGKIESGGYGAPVVKFSGLGDKFGLFVGGQGGWIINHTFVIGGGGYGLVNNIQSKSDTSNNLNIGYGGGMLEYVVNSNDLIHFTVHTLIGAGGVTERRRNSMFWDDSWSSRASSFFVIEPGMNIELNVAKFFRLDAGVSYRYVSGIDFPGISDADVRKLNVQLLFKFGKF